MTRSEACLKIHEIFKAELGVHETPGPESTARIIEYDKHTTLKATNDSIAWCSSLMNFACDTAGFPGAHSAAARSWLEWGVHLEVPIVGCIVVFDRHDANNPNAAHVACCDSADISNEIIRTIGGNVSDQVKIDRSFTSRVLDYRAPF